MSTVGIPRALLYYQYYPMWKTFFQVLGAEVVLSSQTTRAILASGSARVVAETCLPVKVFCGHVLSLVGQCDYVFVPAIRSIEENVYNCSKFLGLPDLVKAVVPDCPPILDVDIDVNKGKKGLYESIYKLARPFTWNPLRAKEAAEAAWHAHLEYQALMEVEKLTLMQALKRCQDGDGEPSTAEPSELTIALIGHPYLIHDEYVNHRIATRLGSLGAKVVTAEMATREELDAGVARLVGRPYWTYEDEVVGAGGHYLESKVDGVISVVAFGCGPDSVMIDVVQRYTKRHQTPPFMALTLDEHTAETGLLTRLEAFVDMIARRKKLGL